MTDEEQARRQTALALQREIRHTRAQVVSDIDELRDAVRIRLSVGYILRSNPRLTQGLSVALGLAGITAFALLWRATRRARRS